MSQRALLWSALTFCAASCGRIDYDPAAGGDGGVPAGDASPVHDGATPDPMAPDASTVDPDTLWWDAAWSHRVRLTIDTTKQTEALLDIPLAVYLDQTRVDPLEIQTSGADLRFVAADNRTLLAHEIEPRPSLGGAGVVGTSVIWVKVPALEVADPRGYIWLYYGNPAAADGQRPADVWSAGYVGVWHLHELDGARADASGHGNTLTAAGTIEGDDGMLGDGADLSVNLQALPLASAALAQGANDVVTGLTIEAWINPVGSGTDMMLAAKSDGAVDRTFELRRLADETISFAVSLDCQTVIEVFSFDLVDVGRWHHIAGTWDGDFSSVYYNGSNTTGIATFARPADIMPAMTLPCTGGAAFTLGALAGGALPFNGLVDELRISGRAHSADWIRAQSQATFDNLITYGPQEPRP